MPQFYGQLPEEIELLSQFTRRVIKETPEKSSVLVTYFGRNRRQRINLTLLETIVFAVQVFLRLCFLKRKKLQSILFFR